MALSLLDFNQKEESTTELRMNAFQPPKVASPAANPDTINSIASYGAALDVDGQLDSVYTSIASELNRSTSSATLDSVISKWNKHDVTGTVNTLNDMLIDPTIDDVQKQDMLRGFQSAQGIESLGYKAGMSSLMSAESDNGEQEDIGVKLAERYNEVNQYNSWFQQTVNAINSEADPQWTDHLNTFLFSMIPFADAADQAMFENTMGAPGTGGAGNAVGTLLMLGENRDRLRNTLNNIPISERKTIVQNMISVIRSTNGSMGNDADTLRQVANLERMIGINGYSDGDRFVDDVFSVLDDTILLSPFTKGAKGALRGLRTLGRGVDEARVSDELIARAGRSAEAVEAPASTTPLMIEYKPALPDWSKDVDNIIDSLPVEPTSAEITQLRSAIDTQVDADTFSIDAIIDTTSLSDRMSAVQVRDLRQNIGVVRDKRTAFRNASVPDVLPTIEEVRVRQVASNPQTNTIAQTYKNTDPKKAIVVHDMIANDTSGRAARILANNTRDNVLAHDFLPEIGTNGRVANKVEFDSDPIFDHDIIRHIKDSEGTKWADAKEVAVANKKATDGFENVIGLKNRSAMATVQNLSPSVESTDVGFRINQVYGPDKGSFGNAYNAVDTVRAALAKYGVADNEITILSRQADGNYAPILKGTDLSNGDFLVQVKYDGTFSPKDIEYTGFNVYPMWKFLRIPDIRFLNKEGGLTQHVIPKSMNIDSMVYNAGITAADRASGIEKQLSSRGKEMVERFNRLPKEQQTRVDDYIRLANKEQIPFNIGGLRSRGISDDGIEVLARWKQMQDTLYHLENKDIVRGLKDRGYQLFEHRASDTKLVVKPAVKSNITSETKLYDPTTGQFTAYTRKQIDELYEQGGQISTLRQPETINNVTVEHIISRNTGNGGFTRTLREDLDNILNYRHGYYHVRYTDPYFIVKRFKDVDGRTIEQAIGRAETGRDARIEVGRLTDTKDGSEYFHRRDRNLDPFEENLSVSMSTGRSAQKIRGKRLDRVGEANDKTLSDHGMESPLDSLVRSISSISNRTAFRNVLDAEKRRWMTQWSKMVKVGSEGFPRFPKSVDDIAEMPGSSEARHAFRHIEQLEMGYGNVIDDMTKAFFSSMSDVAGKGGKGWGWVDKLASKASTGSPSRIGRMTAFTLSIALHPMRQVVLQLAPALVVVSSLGPKYWPKVINSMAMLGSHRAGVAIKTAEKVGRYGTNVDETAEMIRAYELSGLSNAVNAHSYKIDTVNRMADTNLAQRIGSVAGASVRLGTNLGFALGEQTLTDSIFAMEYFKKLDVLKKDKLSINEIQEVAQKVRNLTGDMVSAGDMPYNSNSFSTLMQWLQAPYKMTTALIFGHRGLTTAERARLLAGYTVAFGLPGVYVGDMIIDKMIPPDQQEIRDAVKGGLTNLALNSAFSKLSGEDINVDFSDSLQPMTFEPIVEFIGAAATEGLASLFTDSPSVSLLADDNGRIRKFVKAATDVFVPGSYDGVDEIKQLGITALGLFSGSAAVWKAHLAYSTGTVTTNSGDVVDDDVPFWEALFKAAGMQTIEEKRYWEGVLLNSKYTKEIKEGDQAAMDQYFNALTREGISPTELESYVNVMKFIAHSWESNPERRDNAISYYQMKLRQNPDALQKLMLNGGGLLNDEQLDTVLARSNLDPEVIRQIREMRETLRGSYGD